MDRSWQASAGGATTQFLYDGEALVAEYDGANTVQRRYVHGPNVDEPLLWYEGSGTASPRYLASDERGSIIASTSSGAPTAYAYDAYGAPSNWAGSRFRYTGQIALSEVQIYHYKARAYDPALGRFLQTDPIGFAGGDLNIYAYVANDPVNWGDPWGLYAECWGQYPNITCRNLPDEQCSELNNYCGRGGGGGGAYNPSPYGGESYAADESASRMSPIPERDTGADNVCPIGRTSLFSLNDSRMPTNSPMRATNPFPGSFLVMGHGNPRAIYAPSGAIGARQLAEMIQGNLGYTSGQPVTLGACRIGQNAQYVQALANSLGACVNAPTGYAWYRRSGGPIVSADRDPQTMRQTSPMPWRTTCPATRSR